MTSPDDSRQGGLDQRRLLYLERCQNLIALLAFQSAVLGGERASLPVEIDETRLAVAKVMAAKLASEPHDAFDEVFRRIDAMWAAWVREKVSVRAGDAVVHHARMVLLSAVDGATDAVELMQVATMAARVQLGRELTDGECALLRHPRAQEAQALLQGKSLRIQMADGMVVNIEPPPLEELAEGRLSDVAELVRWLVAQGGYPEWAQRLTLDAAGRLVMAWKRTGSGRPLARQDSRWDGVDSVMDELGLGGISALRKDWERFRRRRGSVSKRKRER